MASPPQGGLSWGQPGVQGGVSHPQSQPHVSSAEKEPLLPGGDNVVSVVAGVPVVADAHKLALQRSSWLHSAFIIIGSTLGTGVLGMPKAVSKIGWVLGMGTVFVFGVCAMYSGILLGRVRNLALPGVCSYSDAATLVGGKRLGQATNAMIMLNWFLLLPYYLMASSNALVISFYKADLCYYEWALVIMAIMLVPLQKRNLHDMHVLALLSDVFAVILLVITLIALAVQKDHSHSDQPGESNDTHLWPQSNESFIKAYGNLSVIVFAYQGQSMFFEVMREMRDSRQFSKTILFSNTIMMLIYAGTCAVAFQLRGDAVANFLPASLHQNGVITLVGCLLLYHIVMGYIITHQPLADRTHVYFFPKDQENPNSFRSRAHWALVGAVYLVLAYLIANTIPFFSDFQGIIGSALGAPIVFFFPAWFYLAGMRKAGRPVSWFDTIVCCVFIFIITPLFVAAGLTSSVKSLLTDWDTFGLPFSCHLVGYS